MIDKMPVRLYIGQPPILPGYFYGDLNEFNFTPNTVDEVYIRRHVENIVKIENVLVISLSILKPNGRLDVRVPDFELVAKQFVDVQTDGEKEKIVNEIREHYDFYWEKKLGRLLELAGFCRIERLKVGDLHMIAYKPDEKKENQEGK